MAEADFPTFELIPAAATDFTPDEELAQLVDPDEILDPVTADDLEPLGKTPFFDFDTERFVLYGDEPATVSDIDAVAQVCQVALKTRRYDWSILPDDFGMEEPDVLVGRVPTAERIAEYQADIRDTLLAAHERVTAVKNMKVEITDTGDVLLQVADVVIDDEATVTIQEVVLA